MNRTQGDQAAGRLTATIRPPDCADLAALTGFFAGLSTQTRVRRFFAPVRPTQALVRLACGWPSHEGRGGGRAGGTDALIAVHGGVIIGHAMAADRAARSVGGSTPPEGQVTEIGVVVADAWQGQRLGSALVRALISRAQARGVTSLTMDVLPENQPVLAMIAAHWTPARTRRHAECVTIEAALPPGPALEPARLVPAQRDHPRELAYPVQASYP